MRSKAFFSLLLGMLGPSLGVVAGAQTVAGPHQGFIARHQARVAVTQRNQPHWATPLITTSPRIEQGFRTDFIRQTSPNGSTVWSYGGTSRGLEIIPFPRTELRVSHPSFLTHSDPRIRDGFGDPAFRVKYRFYGSNEEHHNAIITAVFLASIPTGKNGNGSCCAILTPTLEVGKGFGKLAVTSTAGGTLPVSNTKRLGRTIIWNTAIQYHLSRLVWLEDEFSSTYFKGARNDGRQQTFNTPGITVGRIPLLRGSDPAHSPLSLTLGAGEQIALSHFHTYDHSPVFSVRLRF